MTSPLHRLPHVATGAALLAFFCAKILASIVIVKLSAQKLAIEEFTVFSQLFLFSTLLVLPSIGIQNALIKLVASAPNSLSARRSLHTSLMLWTWLGAAIVILCWLFADGISRLLIASTQNAWAIPVLAVLAVLSGYGQIYAAVLAGRSQTIGSLALQGVGLLLSTTFAVAWLLDKDPLRAVCGAALGNALTIPIGWLQTRSRGEVTDEAPRTAQKQDYLLLIQNSGAFLVVASLMPVALFLLRDLYRAHFGVDALGFWLVANRVSDVTSQLLGLGLRMLFLPAISAATDFKSTRVFVVRTFAGMTAVMSAGLILFLANPSWFIHLFLSEQYLSAAPMITAYLFGDILRVCASMASLAALARQKLWTYIGIEAATVGSFSTFTLILTMTDIDRAPFFAYVATYALLSLCSALYFWHRRR